MILRDWPGWLDSWNGDPQQISSENWAGLSSLAGRTSLPAQTWQSLTGNAANGYALLEANPGTYLCADGAPEKEVLSLAAESMELLEIRDPRQGYRAAAWQYTLTTSMQEQDNPGDFRWRFVHRDNPAFAKFAGAGCTSLARLRARQCAPEEEAFARQGWRKPTCVKITPVRASITEGETVNLEATADGIPFPSFRWFEIQQGAPIEMVGQVAATLQQHPEGRAKRYAVQAHNHAGSADSPVVEITISQRACRLSDQSVLVKPKAAGRGGADGGQDRGKNSLELFLATPFGCRSTLGNFRDTLLKHVFSLRNPTAGTLGEITSELNEAAANIQGRLGEIPPETADVIKECRTSIKKRQARNHRLHWLARGIQVAAAVPVMAAIWFLGAELRVRHKVRASANTSSTNTGATSIMGQVETNSPPPKNEKTTSPSPKASPFDRVT